MPDQPRTGKCPVMHHQHSTSTANKHWWPEQLDLKVLQHNTPQASPMGAAFDYHEALKSLDVATLRRDIEAVMTTSQDWWPADYGHYGPLFVRMAWHAAGTYRTHDGRGGGGTGQQRFAPLNSWPDNANLDKARRLLWPVKQKHGRSISWADLILFAGDCALESMGLDTFGFAFGRPDVWEPEEVNWGPEDTWLGDNRHTEERELYNPLGAVQMGLIYVNPEGPNGKPDPLAAAHDIRETFARMGMDDEETVALIAGGHTFGKSHGAAPDDHVGPEPAGAGLSEQGLGWTSSHGTGRGGDTITSGLEGAWTNEPTRWDSGFFDNLYRYTWTLTKSPAGAWQWTPAEPEAQDTVPDAHSDARRAPMMLTTDLSLRLDPRYAPISERFHADPSALADAFARAWFKLTHRDMGPRSRYRGPLVPAEELTWQDPIPAPDHPLISAQDITDLKARLLEAGLSVSQLVSTAWASAATYRGTDKRGGANGARIRLAPQRGWAANDPETLPEILETLEAVRVEFNRSLSGGKRVSLADTIVLGGCAGVEEAARRAGHDVVVPFSPGRADATAEQTDSDSFAVLEPRFDGFRNYLAAGAPQKAEVLLLERAQLLTLTAPEMTVLVGGMRVLGANTAGSPHGVLTERPETLTTDFFTNLLDTGTVWNETRAGTFEGRDRQTGRVKWTGTRADLIFGSHAQLRAIAEVYASADAEPVFVEAFAQAWGKVMHLDRFDLA